MNPQDHIQTLLELAAKSPCSRDKRGSIVVRDGEVIGRGYNAPVGSACSDGVCNVGMVRDLSGRNEHGYPRQERWTRSCGGHVEHAEAMAIRTALPRKISGDWRSDPDTFDDMLEDGEYTHPLNGCELIHMNARMHPPSMAHNVPAYDAYREAKPSRRRGCPSCAVLASGFGVDAIWLLHEDGWQRWTMAEYAKLAGVV